MWGGEHDETTMAVHNDPSRKTPGTTQLFYSKNDLKEVGWGLFFLTRLIGRQTKDQTIRQAEMA